MKPALSSLALTLAACATAAPPVDAIRGCWIERGDGATRTLRVLPDMGHPGEYIAAFLTYAKGDPEGDAYRIRRDPEGGTVMCYVEPGLPHLGPCVPLLQGSRSNADREPAWRMQMRGRFLAVSLADAAPTLYARDGCD